MFDQGINHVVSVRILVTGRVQRVGFRQAARKQASKLGLVTTAINREDGSVLLETSGPRDAVDRFIAWAHRGPSSANVETVTVINTERPGLRDNSMTALEGTINGA